MIAKALITLIVISAIMGTSAAADSDGKGGQPGAFRDLKLGGRASALGGAIPALFPRELKRGLCHFLSGRPVQHGSFER